MDEIKIMNELLKVIQKADDYESQRRMIEWLEARCAGDERNRLTKKICMKCEKLETQE